MKYKVSVIKKIAFLVMTMALAVAMVACSGGYAGQVPGEPGEPGRARRGPVESRRRSIEDIADVSLKTPAGPYRQPRLLSSRMPILDDPERHRPGTAWTSAQNHPYGNHA